MSIHPFRRLGRTLVAVIVLVSSLPGAVVAEDAWPTFRGPDGDGIVRRGARLPSEWSADSNITWQTELPGEGWSSPVISGGRIYLSAAIANESTRESAPDPATNESKKPNLPPQNYTLALLVVDAESGKLLSTIPLMEHDASRTKKIHTKNSHASPTPIVSGNRLYVHFGYQGTACVTLDGSIVWKNRELNFKPTHGNGGTPILVGDKLIFTCDGDKQPKVVALDADTGKIVWETDRPIKAKKTFSFCTPTAIKVNDQIQVIAPGSDNVLAIDPSSGDVIWDVRYDGYSVVPKPVYHNGLVYVATSFDSSKLLAIDPTGRGVVTDSHVRWRIVKNVPKTPSLVAHEGLIYSVSDDGIVMCADAATGDVVYRKRLGGKFSASPLLADNRLYFTDEEGLTTVIETGREFREIAKNDVGQRTLASLAVIDNALILRTEKSLFRIENQ